jgi:hypothetical protein
VLGPVASPATVWRVLDETGEVQRRRIARARAEVRRRVWGLLEDRREGFPWITVDERPLVGWTVLDSDATPVACASGKEGASGTYKKGVFGLCPLLVYCLLTELWDGFLQFSRPVVTAGTTVLAHDDDRGSS